jgi:hypothetical protein
MVGIGWGVGWRKVISRVNIKGGETARGPNLSKGETVRGLILWLTPRERRLKKPSYLSSYRWAIDPVYVKKEVRIYPVLINVILTTTPPHVPLLPT